MNASIDCCCRGPFGFAGAFIDFTSFFIFGGITPQLKSVHCLTRRTNLVSQKPGSNQVLHKKKLAPMALVAENRRSGVKNEQKSFRRI
jgi:hypothetical protein